jgi:hypothetical protein
VGGEDELAAWARDRGAAFFKPVDEPTLSSLAALGDWVRSGTYHPAAIAPFLGAADFYVVGFAHAHGHIVVTQEVPADSVRRVKIPNACVGMGVRYVNTFEMLRRERARFVLAARPGAA